MSAFDTPQETINWAQTCISKAIEAVGEYLKFHAFARVVQDDLNTNEQVVKIVLANPPTAEIVGLLRNGFVDLKHSFDQSLFAAAQATHCLGFNKNYPWADTESGLKGIIKSRQRDKDAALPQGLIDEILRQEPYATGPGSTGGDNLVREIAKMVNDKHTIGFTAAASVASIRFANISVQSISGGNASFGSRWDPVKKEMEISRVYMGAQVRYDAPDMTANIYFDRAGSVGKVPVIVAATVFANKAQAALDGFKAVCR